MKKGFYFEQRKAESHRSELGDHLAREMSSWATAWRGRMASSVPGRSFPQILVKQLRFILDFERSENQRLGSKFFSRKMDFMRWFRVAFHANGVFIATRVGFELTTHVIWFRTLNHYTTVPQIYIWHPFAAGGQMEGIQQRGGTRVLLSSSQLTCVLSTVPATFCCQKLRFCTKVRIEIRSMERLSSVSFLAGMIPLNLYPHDRRVSLV